MKKFVTTIAMVSVIGAASSLALAETAAENAREAGNAVENGAKNAGNAAKNAVVPNPADAARYPADNSGKNQRDVNEAAVTPGDQGNSDADIQITQSIRKAVTADDSLSVNAHNVKIITNGGVVTLRGPVKSEQERASIASKAQQVSGVTRVNNQLEVAAQ
jgi:osmotically-inducible protein OsmY